MSYFYRYKSVLFLFLSGLCFFLTSLEASFWFFVLPGFAFLLYQLTEAKKYKVALLYGLVIGTIKTAGAVMWIWSVYPLDGMPFTGKFIQVFLIALNWFSTSVAIGLGISLTAIVFVYLNRIKPLLALIMFPFVWCLGEVAGSLLVSLWFLGPGAYPNIYFAHSYVGLSISQLAIFYPWVKFGGLYALSVFASVFGVIFYLLVFSREISRKKAVICLFIVLAILWCVYAISPNGNKDIDSDLRIIAIDTHFTIPLVNSLEGSEIKAEEVQRAVATALLYRPDIILLPEDARFTNSFPSPQGALDFLVSHYDTNTVIVDSARFKSREGRTYLRGFYYDLGAREVYSIDKQYLNAQGEYLTYGFVGLLKLLRQEEALQKILKDKNYEPGPMNGYEEFPSYLPGIMFCSESSSVLAGKFAGAKRDNSIILHPVSHSWFHKPYTLWYQLDSLLRAKAIWSNKTIISATNMAESKIYYPNGLIFKGNAILKTRYWDIVAYNL